MKLYEYSGDHGTRITLENDGEQTLVHLSSTSPGQQQSQGTGFRTGEWSGEPALYRRGAEFIVRLETASGVQGIHIHGHEIRHSSSAPDVHGADRQTLAPADEESRPAKMQPMKPMEPMRPLEPLKPMRPMEMRMGGMQMKMGSRDEPPAKSEQRFCTQCGRAASPSDRFCAGCGHVLNAE